MAEARPRAAAPGASSRTCRRRWTTAGFRSSARSARTSSSTADVFADGHDTLAAVLLCRARATAKLARGADGAARQRPLAARVRRRRARRYEYTVEGWVDRFATWRRELAAKVEAGQDVASELLEGARDRRRERTASPMPSGSRGAAATSACRRAARRGGAVDGAAEAMTATADRSARDPLRPRARRDRRAASARASAPGTRCSRARPAPIPARSAHVRRSGGAPAATSRRWASTCSTCRRSIRSAAASARAATTRSTPGPDDPGSPWAIGAEEGGHTAVEPGLGTLDDFDRFVDAARRARARDRARHRLPGLARSSLGARASRSGSGIGPDGTIKYAENPPKKYQDIYPFDFESADWQALWHELKQVIEFWIGARRDDLPRRQPAHQAASASGSGRSARSSARTPTRSSWPRRSRGRR